MNASLARSLAQLRSSAAVASEREQTAAHKCGLPPSMAAAGDAWPEAWRCSWLCRSTASARSPRVKFPRGDADSGLSPGFGPGRSVGHRDLRRLGPAPPNREVILHSFGG